MKKLLLILLTSIVCVGIAMAQDAVVRSFEAAPMDVTAQQYSRLDRNGVKCALVKVQVVATDVMFQGNVMGDVQKRGSEYWVYLSNGTKMVKIVADSFLPLMYYFPEPLQGGVTYVLTLQAPQSASTAQPQKKKQNFLALKVTPPVAHVTIDGTEILLENGGASKLLPAGTHTFRITAPGYAPVEETVTIADQKVTRTISLRSVKPHLTVTATTPGTEIFINDEKKGLDNWSGELMADSYVIEGRLNSHRANSQTITLADNEKRTVTIPALAPITGSLSIDYTPMDAAVTIDGRAAGTTPLLVEDLLIGTHRVEISAPGYTPATLTATVTEATPATLSGSLSPRPTDPYAADNSNNTLSFSEGLAAVRSDGKWGFIDENFTVVTPIEYDEVRWFSEGLAAVKMGGKWGFIDKSGAMVIPAKYDIAWYFSDGLAVVTENGKDGYIDKSGVMVIPSKYGWLWAFTEGLAAVTINGKWGFIDKNGAVVIPAIYDKVTAPFSNGKAEVELNGRRLYIDRNGKEISAVSATDPYAADIPLTKQYSLFRVSSTGKLGYKHNGSIVIPAKYDRAGNFSEGLAWVKTGGKYGYIDKSGAMVIPAKYDYALYFSEGLAQVKTDYKWGFIDKSGAMVIPAKYDAAGYFSEGLAAVQTDYKWGFVDKSGTLVIPAKYDDVWSSFSNGKAEVKLNGRRFCIDHNGNEVE